MDVLTGAFGSLLPKLLGLIMDEYNLQADVKKRVNDLYKELEIMQAALHDLAEEEPGQPDNVTIIWSKEVRDLSYDAEDVIDSLPVVVEGSQPDSNQGGVAGLIPLLTELVLTMKKRHGIIAAIDGVLKQAHDLSERHKRYKVDHTPRVSTSDPRLSFLFQDPNTLVGVKASRNQVIKMLEKPGEFKSENNLKIVSIVGIGGLGKTTLATQVYNKIQARYDTKAFISVSQKPNLGNVFRQILTEIDRDKYKDFESSDISVLIYELRKILANKRYLIVIDDIWDAVSWERIKVILINNKHESRVITTTRNIEVVQNSGDVYKLKPLSNELSEQLFNARIFNGKANIPPVVDARPKELIQKCGGVPLAIITVASVLATKPVGEWPGVYKKIGFGKNRSISNKNKMVENTRIILLYSYYDLPKYLRTCLLHLNIFPEDHLIQKETLIWKWVAEDFVIEEPGKGLFETGERYFSELIARSVIMPVEDKHRRHIITGCRLHDLVLDMIREVSAEANFVTILDGNEEPKPTHIRENDRRLAVHKRVAGQGDPLANKSTKKLRSFNATDYHFERMLSLDIFEVLRVLAIENCTLLKESSYRLKHLGKLSRLRYLGLYKTPIDKLPEEIGDLMFLQILDLRGTTVKELPRRVAQLRQLKCLRADEGTAVPDWMGNFTSLEELRLDEVGKSVNFVNELGKLTELRELEIWIEEFDENKNKDLVQSVRNLDKIQVLRLMGESSSGDEADWGCYVPPETLRELHITNAFSRLPNWINLSSVPILSYLHLNVKSMEEQDLENLGMLPELVSLKLLMPSNIFPTIKSANSFPKLRCLDTSTTFRFLERAMPSLEFFHFKVEVRALKDANINFNDDSVAFALVNLPSLQQVEVEISSKGARPRPVESAQDALKCAVQKHSQSPTLEIKITED